tara:strand:+ start:188 stop:448 length:261 start_codon:yes stop_codon:yes gene_type:complete
MKRSSLDVITGEITESQLTQEEIDEGVEADKLAFDALNYAEKRQTEYPSIGDQLDLLFHDMTSGKGDKTGEWYKAVNKVKTDNPKG